MQADVPIHGVPDFEVGSIPDTARRLLRFLVAWSRAEIPICSDGRLAIADARGPLASVLVDDEGVMLVRERDSSILMVATVPEMGIFDAKVSGPAPLGDPLAPLGDEVGSHRIEFLLDPAGDQVMTLVMAGAAPEELSGFLGFDVVNLGDRQEIRNATTHWPGPEAIDREVKARSPFDIEGWEARISVPPAS